MNFKDDNRILIANDHGGYEAKEKIAEHLRKKGFEVIDMGSDSQEIVRYPNYVKKVAAPISAGDYNKGILICSTGIGMSIAANKYKGVRAAVVGSHYEAKMTRQHNDSNILCLGGKTKGIFELIDYVDTWLENDYIGDRHTISLGIIEDIENELGIKEPGQSKQED
ncbi:MAG: ribose 5-phosphate isomerase B [Cyclobacteriaceae bacterium]|nr:ribose 5-phosphate isomerase B [Cyclobacteriaceae bacterium]